MLHHFLNDLRALGFTSEHPVDGAAVVDLINQYWPTLENASGTAAVPAAPAGVPPAASPSIPHIVIDLEGGLVRQVYSSVPVPCTTIDHDVEFGDPDDDKLVKARNPLRDQEEQLIFVAHHAAHVDPDLCRECAALPTERPRFLNHYHCPACNESWQDEWDCACDDECPKCQKSYTPEKSEEIKS